MNDFKNINEHSLYPDLVRELQKRGHIIDVVTPLEKKYGKETFIKEYKGIRVIYAKTGNLFNVGLINKFLSRLQVGKNYMDAINGAKREKYDLILYSTPPTTFAKLVKKIKKSDNAYSYLMLKDIFPQNAVDLGMIRKNGILYTIFRQKEKELYSVSDTIGCMSPANVTFLEKQDPWIPKEKITICPNAIEVREKKDETYDRKDILKRYGIPEDRIVLVYGGGLGKPQGIEFLIECIGELKKYKKIFLVIIGDGIYYEKLKEIEKNETESLRVIKWLPVEEYETIVNASDVGLIFLNHQFTIPNFPSRLLLYMQAGIPVLAATDCSTDIGRIIEKNEFGLWCESNDVNGFLKCLNGLMNPLVRKRMGDNARTFLEENYNSKKVAEAIEKKVSEHSS